MYKIALLIVVLLSGCGEYSTQYSCGNQYVKVDSDVYYNVDNFAYNLNLSKDILSEMMSYDEFCTTYTHLPIKVMPTNGFDCIAYKEGCGGYTSIFLVQIGTSGRSLLHEFMHVYQIKKLDVSTATHENWDELGFNRLIDIYEHQYRSLEE